eukprot:CAMPEP_0114545380 /NCGR_PEP_ID=MMETSP0114-20121206/3368_1 /TAXON_ID=31324 /ORGANISM="Goniomonas sp, Strain m" /LENGTH=159 /DNA_ID=CAMNT_0001729801 /DNA_START=343 /DNA_END=822 /DNA_ORIENTATION=+
MAEFEQCPMEYFLVKEISGQYLQLSGAVVFNFRPDVNKRIRCGKGPPPQDILSKEPVSDADLNANVLAFSLKHPPQLFPLSNQRQDILSWVRNRQLAPTSVESARSPAGVCIQRPSQWWRSNHVRAVRGVENHRHLAVALRLERNNGEHTTLTPFDLVR